MDDQLKAALVARLTATADDELLLAHRDSEWTGIAPILEEDIAIANIAQDELGHATVIYGLVEELTGQTADELAYFRDPADFRNVQLVEMPRGDWAYTMLRQYLFDAYEHVLLESLTATAYTPLMNIAAKLRNEELYHLRHSYAWVERLGLGTLESNGRMQKALDELWPLTTQLFLPLPQDDLLVAANYFPDVASFQEPWLQIVRPHLKASELSVPHVAMVKDGRDAHTPHLTQLLADFQQVARWDPQADW